MKEKIAHAIAANSRRSWDDMADAVLAALEKPTPEMINAGWGEDDLTGITPGACWQAMIRAAKDGK